MSKRCRLRKPKRRHKASGGVVLGADGGRRHDLRSARISSSPELKIGATVLRVGTNHESRHTAAKVSVNTDQ